MNPKKVKPGIRVIDCQYKIRTIKEVLPPNMYPNMLCRFLYRFNWFWKFESRLPLWISESNIYNALLSNKITDMVLDTRGNLHDVINCLDELPEDLECFEDGTDVSKFYFIDEQNIPPQNKN